MSSAEEEDLPCMSPLEDTFNTRTAEHVGISFEQLLLDSRIEKNREKINNELQRFTLDDTDEEEDEEEEEEEKEADPEAEVIAYGTKYITGYDNSLPEIMLPEEVQALCPADTKPDLLVLLPWGPILRDFFQSPAHYQVWLFGLVCYCQDVDVSKQATYLLISELEKPASPETYMPTSDDICNVFDDYGAGPVPQLVKLYEPIETPPYFNNIRNALEVYACAVKVAQEADLDHTITVVKLIVRLCQDQHLTCKPEFFKYSDIFSNIFDGLGSFTSIEIDKISSVAAKEVASMLVAPALCQVMRSGNQRCHLILEQLSLLILADYAGIAFPQHGAADPLDRPQLHHIILGITGRSIDSPEEYACMCTVLDYHIAQGVMNKDQLSELVDALCKMQGSIPEHQDDRLFAVKTQVVRTIHYVRTRLQISENSLEMFN